MALGLSGSGTITGLVAGGVLPILHVRDEKTFTITFALGLPILNTLLSA